MQFLSVGLNPTFQDAGRFGFQALGVNPDGVMDTYAFRLLNILLQNDVNEGILEMNFPAPKLLFEENATICLGGADFSATLNNLPIPLFKTVIVGAGDVLKFQKKLHGERTYLAVKGGFDLEKWLGSSSYNQAVNLPNLKVEKGLSVALKTGGQTNEMVWLGRPHPALLRDEGFINKPSLVGGGLGGGFILRFLPGPEYFLLTPASRQALQNTPFQITKDTNRMGYRLLGEKLNTAENVSLLSSAVTFGTMQLLPNGQIIVLMASHQTTGGYPRIGTIISVDLPKLAQMGSSSEIYFRESSFAEANNLFLEQEKQLQRLDLSVKLKLTKQIYK